MIKLLHIENIAVIEKADVEFTSGLNVLTGETGAGKSIVIDALLAVTGGRTSRDIIRTGADHASVTAVFSGATDDKPGGNTGAKRAIEASFVPAQDQRITGDSAAWFDDNGIEADESGDIFISRKISADGKSVCRVNGAPVSAAQLRELGAVLVDIHGQNDGRKLLDESAHLNYLDLYGGSSGELAAFQESYKRLCGKKTEIEKLSMDESEKARRIDALAHQIGELERAKLRVGEYDEIASRRELLLNASKLTEAVETAFEAMYGGDNASGAVALISDARDLTERAAKHSEGLRAISRRLLDLQYTAQDISDELRDFRAILDYSPGELDGLEARLDVLKRIIRKYGGEAEALAYLDKAMAELSDIEDSSNRLEKLEKELDICLKEAVNLADTLSKKRKAAATALEAQVKDELLQLNMPGVEFVVRFDDARGGDGLSPTGRDEALFLISANAGEKPGRISRIASGGELARIMLALKNVLRAGQDTGAMVFDEIDAGVSGIAAQRVGEKLSVLALERQVLCVTHLPQIAVMADTHFEILKTVSGGRTFTHVNELDLEGRKKELARLSGGENITITTLTSAAEQLEAAGTFKKCRKKM